MRREASLVLLVVLIIGLIAVVLMNWRRDTHVSFKVTVDRLQFVVAGDDKTPVMDAGNVKALLFDEFKTIHVETEKLILIAENRSRQIKPDGNTILIRAQDDRYQSNVGLSVPDDKEGSHLTMDPLRATPGTKVIFELSDDPDELAVQLHKQVSGNIISSHAVRFELNNCEVSGINGYLDGKQNVSVVAQLTPSTSINFGGQQNSIHLTMIFPREETRTIFPQTSIPITGVAFERQVEGGAVISSVVGPSEIAYPDHADTKVTIEPGQFITLADLNQFTIKSISWNQPYKSFVVDMEGIAGQIHTGSPEFNIDRRKTAFDSLMNNHQILILGTLLAGAFSVLVAIYKFIRSGKVRRAH